MIFFDKVISIDKDLLKLMNSLTGQSVLHEVFTKLSQENKNLMIEKLLKTSEKLEGDNQSKWKVIIKRYMSIVIKESKSSLYSTSKSKNINLNINNPKFTTNNDSNSNTNPNISNQDPRSYKHHSQKVYFSNYQQLLLRNQVENFNMGAIMMNQNNMFPNPNFNNRVVPQPCFLPNMNNNYNMCTNQPPIRNYNFFPIPYKKKEE